MFNNPVRLIFCACLGLAVADACPAEPVIAPADPGEVWVYRELNGYNNLQTGTLQMNDSIGELAGSHVSRLDAAHNQTVINRYENGSLLFECSTAGIERRYVPGLIVLPLPLEEGKNWNQTLAMTDNVTRKSLRVKVRGKVRGWEKIRVPAGEFDALKIVRQDFFSDMDWWRTGTRRFTTDWYAPSIKIVVRHEETESYLDVTIPDESVEVRGDKIVWELVSRIPKP